MAALAALTSSRSAPRSTSPATPGDSRDLETARRWLARDTDFAAGGLAVVGALRLARGQDPAAADAVRAWIAAHRDGTAQPEQMARVWGSTTPISDAAARGDWSGVVATAIAEHGVALTQPGVDRCPLPPPALEPARRVRRRRRVGGGRR